MNTKLDVVRFECEDVIATSGFCSEGRNANHLHIKRDGENYKMLKYRYNATPGEYVPLGFIFNKDQDGPLWSNYNSGEIPGITDAGWYYLDENNEYKVCTGHHNHELATPMGVS